MMNYFILALVFYFQNLIISFFISFVFIPNIFELLFLFSLILLISKLKYFKFILFVWQLLYLIHFSFIAYFGTTLTYIDIYLFFTHISETFETLFSMYDVLFIPFIFSLVIIIYIFFIKVKRVNFSYKFLLITSILLFYFIPKLNDTSFIIIKEILKTYKLSGTNKIVKNNHLKLKPIDKKDINIVLVLGESMRAKEFLEDKYEFLENENYKTIFSGAINTDVSIPLLINGAIRPNDIDLKQNLFYLAKKNDFITSFITTQSKKSLKYIKPYLSIENIDNFNILNSLDINLVKKLKQIDLTKRNLVILQMQGQHSPYIYYPHSNRLDSIKTRYKKSMEYSNNILLKIMKYVKDNSKKPYVFIFTSDHGEQIGLNGKFGHNKFEKEVYSVPFVYDSSFDKLELDKIGSHNNIYNILYHYLGYSNTIKYNDKIRVYGTMITEEDGFIDIKKR